MSKETDLLVGLDIGTTEVRCLVGVAPNTDDGKFQILGIGVAPNEGMRNGVVVNHEEVVAAVDSAIKQAELNVGYKINALTVNINGSHLASKDIKAEVAISNQERVVGLKDCLLVDRKARESAINPNQEMVQFFPNYYRVDQLKQVVDPIGIGGNVLGVKAVVVSGHIAHYQALQRALREIGVQVNHTTLGSLAISEATYNKKALESGVAIIDIGHSTTNLMVIIEDQVKYVEVLALGGFNVTKDIAIILQVDLEVAEFLKTKHADLNYEGRGTKTIDFNRQQINFSPQNLAEVTSARYQEIIELIETSLREKGFFQNLPGGIILTGGGSLTKGLLTVFKDELGMHVRYGRLKNLGGLTEVLEDQPTYLTAAGLLILDYNLSLNRPAKLSLMSNLLKTVDIFNVFKSKYKTRKAQLRTRLESRVSHHLAKQQANKTSTKSKSDKSKPKSKPS